MERSEPTKIVQVVVFLVLGLWIGIGCGLGFAFARVEALAARPPVINGSVTIVRNGFEPVAITGMTVDMSNLDCGTPGISVETIE